MEDHLIVCYSITCAQRSAQILQNAGIRNHMLRLPAGAARKGCGYAVQVAKGDVWRAMHLLKQQHITGISLMKRVGVEYAEVPYDIL